MFNPLSQYRNVIAASHAHLSRNCKLNLKLRSRCRLALSISLSGISAYFTSKISALTPKLWRVRHSIPTIKHLTHTQFNIAKRQRDAQITNGVFTNEILANYFQWLIFHVGRFSQGPRRVYSVSVVIIGLFYCVARSISLTAFIC